MKALILVDIQNDFVPGGALAVPEGDQIIPVVNRIQPCFECIVATQDWHPRDHGSFAVNHPGKKAGEMVELNGLTQILWPVHCVQQTPGAEFVRNLSRDKWRAIFQKGTDREIDSYSGFFDNGHRKETGLAQFLRDKKVDGVYVAGLALDYCVKFTALDARELGFKVCLIEDACRGVNLDPHDSEHALEEMRERGVSVLQSTKVRS